MSSITSCMESNILVLFLDALDTVDGTSGLKMGGIGKTMVSGG